MMLTKLRILDALAGAELETLADLQRRHDRERIERAFPRSSREEPSSGSPIHGCYAGTT
jgi:hypothetical protein